MPSLLISLEAVDTEDHRMSTALYFDAANVTTVAEATTAATEWAALLNAMTGSRYGLATVTFNLGDVGGGAVTTPAYTNDRGATLSFQNSDGIVDSIYVPGFLMSKVSSGVVADGDAAVAAFIDEVENATTVTHRLSSRGSGSLWTAYRRGKQTTRKVTR